MKNVLVILLSVVIFVSATFAQPADSLVTFTKKEVENITNNIKTLERNLDIEEKKNEKLNQIVDEYEIVMRQDSSIIGYKDQQIKLLKEEIALHEKKKSFFNSETWGFIQGAGLIILSSWVLSNIQ